MFKIAKKIAIIGGGPGGYVAAIRAAMLGAEVTLIEKSKLGGTCLNKGCIPTKALYKNAEMLYSLKHSEKYGITLNGYSVDIAKVQERKTDIVNKLVLGIDKILKSYNVNVIKGEASILNKNTVEVIKESTQIATVESDYIIIATGSAPILPPIKGAENTNIITSEQALEFSEVPESIVIIGGGVIGMEFANIYNSFGSKVFVVEAAKSILGKIDSAIAKRYQSMAKKLGITIYTGSRAKEFIAKENGVNVLVEGKKGDLNIFSNKVLISVGRKPITQGLNLTKIDIEHSKYGIKVNKNYTTNINNIYAIGDVNGESMLAHAASHQGIIAVEHIMGVKNGSHKAMVPSCIFVSPEIAVVGQTEDELKEQGVDYLASRFMFSANGKAMTIGEDEGFIKVLADSKKKVILGVHILGPHASDLIHEGVLAVQNKLTVEQIKQTIHAHPTLSEVFHEAVLGIENETIHKTKSLRK